MLHSNCVHSQHTPPQSVYSADAISPLIDQVIKRKLIAKHFDDQIIVFYQAKVSNVARVLPDLQILGFAVSLCCRSLLIKYCSVLVGQNGAI